MPTNWTRREVLEIGAAMLMAGATKLPSAAGDSASRVNTGAETVVLVADPHMQTESERDEVLFAKLAEAVVTEKPDLILNLGDVAESGRPDEYEKYQRLFVRPVEASRIPLHEVLGNHDNIARWREVFGDRGGDAVVTFGDYRFLLLLQSTKPGGFGHVSNDELAWLETELAENAPCRCFLVLHHPLVKEVGYRTWRPEGWTRPYFYADNGAEAVQRLSRFGNFAGVFSGHLHANRVRVADGVLQMAAAPCCSRTLSNRYAEPVPFGYWVIEVSPGQVVGRFKEVDAALAAASRKSNADYYAKCLGTGLDRGFVYDVKSRTAKAIEAATQAAE